VARLEACHLGPDGDRGRASGGGVPRATTGGITAWASGSTGHGTTREEPVSTAAHGGREPAAHV